MLIYFYITTEWRTVCDTDPVYCICWPTYLPTYKEIIVVLIKY